jgi:hypothetical protein
VSPVEPSIINTRTRHVHRQDAEVPKCEQDGGIVCDKFRNLTEWERQKLACQESFDGPARLAMTDSRENPGTPLASI